MRKLSLRNIKCYEKAEIELSPTLNVIIGDNNSGKSTILRTIYRLQANNSNNNGILRNGTNYGTITFDFVGGGIKFFVHDDKKKQSLKHYSPQIGQHDRIALITHKDKVHFMQLDDAQDFYDRLSQIPENGIENYVLENANRFDGFSSMEPDNVFHAAFTTRSNFFSTITEDEMNRVSSDYSNLAARLQKIQNPSIKNRHAFSRACMSILGFEPGVIYYGSASNNATIGLSTDSTKKIDIQNMGQGVLNVLNLLTILFTQERKIILLEEIENDLHPKVLKKVLELIIRKSKENQFIVSTHSNIVLKALGSIDGCRIFQTMSSMKPTKGFKMPFSQIAEITNEPANRIKVLTDLGYELLDFDLHQAYLLLEESTAETIIRDYLVPTFVPSLQNRIKTISAKGTGNVEPMFNDFLRLFTFIHTSPIYAQKAWVIVDGDTSGLEVTKNLKRTFRSWPEGHFVSLSKKHFEEYYPERFANKVNQILKMKHGLDKQEAKKELLNEVSSWTREFSSVARKEFQQSAMDIIKQLRLIERELN